MAINLGFLSTVRLAYQQYIYSLH